jgi:hypothetical protein
MGRFLHGERRGFVRLRRVVWPWRWAKRRRNATFTERSMAKRRRLTYFESEDVKPMPDSGPVT